MPRATGRHRGPAPGPLTRAGPNPRFSHLPLRPDARHRRLTGQRRLGHAWESLTGKCRSCRRCAVAASRCVAAQGESAGWHRIGASPTWVQRAARPRSARGSRRAQVRHYGTGNARCTAPRQCRATWSRPGRGFFGRHPEASNGCEVVHDRVSEPGRTHLRWVPGILVFRRYQRSWLRGDLVAGLVLAALLVPQGMAYAELAGLPAVHGLYATLVPLLAYAILGPSRILVLGPDSAVAPVVAAAIIPDRRQRHRTSASPWPVSSRFSSVGFASPAASPASVSSPISSRNRCGSDTSQASPSASPSARSPACSASMSRGAGSLSDLTGLVRNLDQTDLASLVLGGGALVLIVVARMDRAADPLGPDRDGGDQSRGSLARSLDRDGWLHSQRLADVRPSQPGLGRTRRSDAHGVRPGPARVRGYQRVVPQLRGPVRRQRRPEPGTPGARLSQPCHGLVPGFPDLQQLFTHARRRVGRCENPAHVPHRRRSASVRFSSSRADSSMTYPPPCWRPS